MSSAHHSDLLDDPELRALAEEFQEEFDDDDGGEMHDDENLPEFDHFKIDDGEEDLEPDAVDGGSIDDSSIAGELAALSAAVARESGGADKVGDSDDELAALEAEEEKKEAAKRKKSAMASAPSNSAGPAKAAAPASSRASPEEISKLQAELTAAKTRAVTLKRAGDQSGAIEALRGAKLIEQKIALADKAVKAAETAKAQPPPAKQNPPSASAANQQMPVLQALLKDYQVAAITAKKANRLTEARELLMKANAIKALIERINKGGTVKNEEIPTALPKKSAPPAAQATAKTQITASNVLQSATTLSSIESACVGAALSVREDLSYDSLLSKLQAQIDSLAAHVKRLLVDGQGSESSKLLAVPYNRWRKRSQNDFDLVTAARKKNLPMPAFHEEKVKLQEEIQFPEIPDDAIRVEIQAAAELRPAKEIGVNPEDLNPYILCKLDFGGAEFSFQTDAKKKCAQANFNAVNVFRLPDVRTKAGARKVKAAKLSFTVLHKRSFLFSSLEVGHGDLKLKDLMARSEIVERVKLRAAGDSRKAGEISIVVRVKKPFEALDIRETEKEFIVVDEFFTGEKEKLESKTMEKSENSAAPVAPAAVAAPPPLPAGVDETDIAAPHHISSMFSNDVLEAEIVAVQAKIAAAGGNAELVENLKERLMEAQTQLTILVNAVQNGNLSLDRYLEKLKESIVHGQSLSIALSQRGRKGDALEVLKRVQIMKNEVKAAEENREELDE